MAVIFIRTLIIFTALIIAMRLMGKRQLGELELSELVITVLLSDLASHPLQDIGVPLLNGLIPIVTLLCCQLLITTGIVKSPRFRLLICGKPSVLVENGRICESEMRKNSFTLDELTEELRNQGYMDISKIKFAILETDGSLNAIPYPAESPVTPSQMHLQVDDPGFPYIVINDGRVMSNNLIKLGLDEKWLEKELRKRKAESPKAVYLMIVNDAKQIFFSAKEEKK